MKAKSLTVSTTLRVFFEYTIGEEDLLSGLTFRPQLNDNLDVFPWPFLFLRLRFLELWRADSVVEHAKLLVHSGGELQLVRFRGAFCNWNQLPFGRLLYAVVDSRQAGHRAVNSELDVKPVELLRFLLCFFQTVKRIISLLIAWKSLQVILSAALELSPAAPSVCARWSKRWLDERSRDDCCSRAGWASASSQTLTQQLRKAL